MERAGKKKVKNKVNVNKKTKKNFRISSNDALFNIIVYVLISDVYVNVKKNFVKKLNINIISNLGNIVFKCT